MSFKNLEERFNAQVNNLYAAAQNKYDGGRKSDGANDDPLITRRVADGYWGFGESRSTPIRSSAQDVRRLTLFTFSQRGILFLAKQQLLQTGNTFEQTRLLNPAFIVGNAVPFLHIRRNLRPITGEFGLTSSRDSIRSNARLLGQLQPSTFDTVRARYLSKNTSGPNFLGRLGAGLKSLVQPFTSTLSAVTAPRDVGDRGGRSVPGTTNPDGTILGETGTGWGESRPEIGTITNEVLIQRASFQAEVDKFFRDNQDGITGQRRGSPSDTVPDGLVLVVPNSQPFLKYFTSDPESISKRGDQMNARDLAQSRTDTSKHISYIRDPLNEESPTDGNVLERYKKLHTTDGTDYKDDAILVSFAMGNNDHVQFRSFIRDLRQSANPEYKTYQYIGRIERFIYYVSVEREISFKLDLIAFSKEELGVVWNRINYLTSMVFPFGVNRGILQPNIIKMTIGNVYNNQSCYITNFNTSFNEVSESWDIDREVPIAATINITAKLIENTTKTANSPHYGITGDVGQTIRSEQVNIRQPAPAELIRESTPASLGPTFPASLLRNDTSPRIGPSTVTSILENAAQGNFLSPTTQNTTGTRFGFGIIR